MLEEASQEDGASPPGVESPAGSSGIVPATSAGEPAAQIHDRLHENVDNLLEEEKRSEAGALPQGAGDFSSATTPSILPGDASAALPGVKPSSTSAGVAPDAPHHEAASTRFNPSVEEVFDSTHAKR